MNQNLHTELHENILALSSEDARRWILRHIEAANSLPVDVIYHAHITKDELQVAEAMMTSGEDPQAIKTHCKGGIWISVVNAIFRDLSSVEARVYILERAYHPLALTKEIKAYAETGDDLLLKANFYRHSQGFTGIKYWKKFHPAYVLKGMEAKQAMRFLLEHDYVVSDVPERMYRVLKIDPNKLSYANSLLHNKTPQETVYQILGI